MNVIIDAYWLNWRPLVEIPEQHKQLFENWRSTQVAFNLAKGLKPEYGSQEYTDWVDLSLELTCMRAACTECLYELVKDTGWYTQEFLYEILFTLEHDHPFIEIDDDRPVISLVEYKIKCSFTSGGSVEQLIELLRNIPPTHKINKSINIDVRDGEFSITTD